MKATIAECLSMLAFAIGILALAAFTYLGCSR